MSSVRTLLGLALSVAIAAASTPVLAQQKPYEGRGAVVQQSRPAAAPALRTIAIAYKEFPSSDPVFKNLWTLDPRRIDVPGYPPQAYVGYVREATGSLLTVTMLSAPEECGPNKCSMKVLRDGKLIKEFVGCSDPAGHRITADGRFLMVCDATVPLQ